MNVGRKLKRRTLRGGMTLLEIVLALGIFLVAMSVISQLISNGVRGSLMARFETQAVLRCESKLAEIVAGVEPMDQVSEESFPDDPLWVWSLQSEPTEIDDLVQITVTVERTADSELGRVSFSLDRLIRDPEIYRQAAEALAASSEGG